jgi:hypothetical protein
MNNHFELLARAGYSARGVVYLLLGGLALASALWGGAAANGSSDALSSLLGLPFGRILLGIVAIGLFGHILWRLAQGLLNADGVDDDAKGFVTRVGQLASAGANVFLALAAAGMALGMGSGGGEGSGEADASAWLISQPFGPYLLGAVALAVIGAGLAQVWRGVTRQYRKRIDLPPGQPVLDLICQFGLSARGALLAIIGGFVLYAALTVSPEQAGGISEALQYVHGLPFGRWLYGVAALGLVAFGGYSIIQGAFRRIDAPDAGALLKAAGH